MPGTDRRLDQSKQERGDRVKKDNVISFDKYFQPHQRAKARAAEITAAVKKQMNGYVFLPETDPFRGKSEEEVTKVLFECEMLLDQYKKKKADQ